YVIVIYIIYLDFAILSFVSFVFIFFFFFFFFFQAEDGIRDRNVTGVQTCALPISRRARQRGRERRRERHALPVEPGPVRSREDRSEERRVGKECRSRWSPDH